MDIIAIHKAFTQIWPDGIPRESYPVLAGIVKVMLDLGPAREKAQYKEAVETLEAMLGGLDTHPKVIPDSVRAPLRPTPLEVLSKIAAEVTQEVIEESALPPVSRPRSQANADRISARVAPTDPSGRVNDETMRRVYAYVISHPGLGAATISRNISLAFSTARRALGRLVTLGYLRSVPRDGNPHWPHLYTATTTFARVMKLGPSS